MPFSCHRLQLVEPLKATKTAENRFTSDDLQLSAVSESRPSRKVDRSHFLAESLRAYSKTTRAHAFLPLRGSPLPATKQTMKFNGFGAPRLDRPTDRLLEGAGSRQISCGPLVRNQIPSKVVANSF